MQYIISCFVCVWVSVGNRALMSVPLAPSSGSSNVTDKDKDKDVCMSISSGESFNLKPPLFTGEKSGSGGMCCVVYFVNKKLIIIIVFFFWFFYVINI